MKCLLEFLLCGDFFLENGEPVEHFALLHGERKLIEEVSKTASEVFIDATFRIAPKFEEGKKSPGNESQGKENNETESLIDESGKNLSNTSVNDSPSVQKGKKKKKSKWTSRSRQVMKMFEGFSFSMNLQIEEMW